MRKWDHINMEIALTAQEVSAQLAKLWIVAMVNQNKRHNFTMSFTKSGTVIMGIHHVLQQKIVIANHVIIKNLKYGSKVSYLLGMWKRHSTK